MGRKEEERAVPTPKEILRDCRAGIGGVCYSLGYFNFWVLQALGYKSYLVLCNWKLAKTETFIHLGVVAEKVEREDDLYFVEVATSFPTLAPIPLHDLPQEYHDVFLTYRFSREGNTISRSHLRKNSKIDNDSSVKKWDLLSEFDLEQRSDEYIRWCLEPVYIQPHYACMFYLTDLRITLYPEDSAITLTGTVLRVWNKGSNEVKVIQLKDVHEVENAIKTYFPMLSSVVTQQALSCIKFPNDN